MATRLFDRSPRGIFPTPRGHAFIERIREAEARFAEAEVSYRAFARGKQVARHNPVFTLDVSQKRLAAFLALYETRDVQAAADKLGQTRAAVYSSIRHLEGLLDLPLFEHAGPHITSSVFGDVLANYAKLAFALIRHGIDELRCVGGVTEGSVAIGTLPYSRTELTPRTIHRVLEDCCCRCKSAGICRDLILAQRLLDGFLSSAFVLLGRQFPPDFLGACRFWLFPGSDVAEPANGLTPIASWLS